MKTNSTSIYNLDSIILEKLVEYCCKLKASVVSKDEKESDLRAILNLGHTIGHAIEKTTDYKKFTHGEAISLGIVGAFKLALDKNLIEANYLKEVLELLNQYKIIPKPTIDAKKIVKATAYDKKVVDSKIRFVLPTAKAEVAIFDDIKDSEIIKAVNYIKKSF